MCVAFMPLWRNWKTRLTQNQVPKGVSVRVRLEAPSSISYKGGITMADITFLYKLVDAETYNSTHTDYYYGKFQGLLEGAELLGNEVSYEFDGTYIQSVSVNGVTEPTLN